MEETGYKLIADEANVGPACESLSRRPEIGFDTETTALSPLDEKKGTRVRLVQLASDDAAYVFDLDKLAPGGDAARAEALEPLRRLLASTRPVKIAHNAKFDAKWVRHFLGVELCGDYDSRAAGKNEVERGGLFDTLLASQLVSAGEQEDRHSLAVVAERYLGKTVDKTLQVSDWGGELSPAQIEYAARDAALMLPLRAKLVGALRANSLTRIAWPRSNSPASISNRRAGAASSKRSSGGATNSTSDCRTSWPRSRRSSRSSAPSALT
ncbi:MAG: hypothetical protein DMF66_14050 [Acidobacteria bacterium]|nr:MAG: hypothetical protein DMF66_14050 [Acidobacteriota bacterium]